MSPHEMDDRRVAFGAAAARLGWVRRRVTVYPGRDGDRPWEEAVWFTADGRRLFSEDDLSPGLAGELIRLAGPP